jgi:hypothetical protein
MTRQVKLEFFSILLERKRSWGPSGLLQSSIINLATLRLPLRGTSSLAGGEPDHRQEQEADRMRMPDQRAPLGMAWDFSKPPIYQPGPTSHSTAGFSTALARAPHLDSAITCPDRALRGTSLEERIDGNAMRFVRLESDEAGGVAPGPDGSPDELEEQVDDHDALAPSTFERRPNGRGVHTRVPGGNPAGTPDFPDGIRWIQTIDTNAPLGGRSSPYVDYIPPADDGKPFYFTDARENATFSDNPSRSANGVRWDAMLSLVGVRGRTVTRLDSVKYGFAIDGSGALSLSGPSATSVGDLVIHGDTLRSEYPDWVFSGGFAVPQVSGGGATGGTATV